MKKVLLALVAAVLATAAFFLYSLATVELPEMDQDSLARSYSDVEPLQSQVPAASSNPGQTPEP